MDLRTCPSCDAFVRPDWTNCRSCGHDLSPALPEPEPVLAQHEPEAASQPQAAAEAHETAPLPAFAEPVVQPAAEPAPTPAFGEPVVERAAEPLQSASAEPRSEPVATPQADVQQQPTWTNPGVTLNEQQFAYPGSYGYAAAPPTAPTPPTAPAENHVYLPYSGASTSNGWTHPNGLGMRTIGPVQATRTPVYLAVGGGILAIVLVMGFSMLGSNRTAAQERKWDAVNAAPTTTIRTTTTTAAPQAPSDGWNNYTDPKGRFTVQIPGTPSATNQNNGQLLTSELSDGHSAAMLFVADLPAGSNMSKNDQLLKQSMNSDAAAMGVKVKSSIASTVGDHRQLDAHARNTDGTKVVDVRYFVVNDTFYGLFIVTDNPDGDPEAFSRLTDSFHSTK